MNGKELRSTFKCAAFFSGLCGLNVGLAISDIGMGRPVMMALTAAAAAGAGFSGGIDLKNGLREIGSRATLPPRPGAP